MTRTSASRTPWCVLAVLALAAGCGGEAPEQAEPEEPEVAMVEGACGEVFGAEVCTWAELQGDRVVAMGVDVPMAFVEGAPADAEMMWPPVENALIALPEAVTRLTGVHNLKLYWEAHGHPPGPYLVPHFDFHFYTIDSERLDAIDCSDTAKPSETPAGYELPDVEIPEIGNLVGLCVPAMGMHALRSDELQSEESFTGTMVVGYYGQSPIFYEPMITRELLMAQESFSLDMPSIPNYDDAVLPTAFEAVYDAEAASYRFTFSGFPAASGAE